jgi:hypothetical protein
MTGVPAAQILAD